MNPMILQLTFRLSRGAGEFKVQKFKVQSASHSPLVPLNWSSSSAKRILKLVNEP
jgi:hypothetical protein